jgi:hypothetical protein
LVRFYAPENLPGVGAVHALGHASGPGAGKKWAVLVGVLFALFGSVANVVEFHVRDVRDGT